MSYLPANYSATRKRFPIARFPIAQHGVVLIISLILLVVISLLAVTSMRNAGSSESISSNVRTTELATQAAEIALRHCESSVLSLMGGTAYPQTHTPTFTVDNIFPANMTDTSTPATPRWQDKSTSTGWDSTATVAYMLPLELVNQTDMAITTYKRPPECMVERQPVVLEGPTVVNTTSSFVITARGFGPEVAKADGARTRPQGSEVWMQSNIQIK